MNYTEQQLACISAMSGSESLCVVSYAGTGKTSTIIPMVSAVSVPVLAIAFNKRIQQELEKKLPGHALCKTINGLGHSIWAKAIAHRINLTASKSYDIVKAIQTNLPKSESREFSKYFSDIFMGIREAKRSGYIPPGTWGSERSLISRDEFLASLEETISPYAASYIDECIVTSIKQAYSGTIDFDDQIYMPTLFGGTFPNFPITVVDEAQDLSTLNHAFLRKLVRERLIIVGDPYQSIYGFRGAEFNGMEKLSNEYSMRQLKLSTSFRCPEEIVQNVRWHVPDFQASSQGGFVRNLDTWIYEDIPDSAAVICRNNAPLFKLALTLLRGGRSVQLLGSDIGPGLIKVAEKLGDLNMPRDYVHTAIEEWATAASKKSRNPDSVEDRANCLHVFADVGSDLGAMLHYMKHLFAQTGKIKLMSGHKSKGLEFDEVFHLDSWRIPGKYAKSPEAIAQENNVKYVIDTRAKNSLTYISMADD